MSTLILNAQIREGFVILIVGLLIIFSVLLLLFVVFQYAVPTFMSRVMNRSVKKTDESEITEPAVHTGEEIAAIAAAIHAFLDDIHDKENPILTIHKSKKDYSPWSSKIYTTHNLRKRRN